MTEKNQKWELASWFFIFKKLLFIETIWLIVWWFFFELILEEFLTKRLLWLNAIDSIIISWLGWAIGAIPVGLGYLTWLIKRAAKKEVILQT